MPKKLIELKNFQKGTESSPSSSDINMEGNIYAKNIDPISEAGKLKGTKKHRKVEKSGSDTVYVLLWPYHTSTSSAWVDGSGVSLGQSAGSYSEALLQDDITIIIRFEKNGVLTEFEKTYTLVGLGTHSTGFAKSKAFIDSIITDLNDDSSLNGLTFEKWYPPGNPGYTYYTGTHSDNLPYFNNLSGTTYTWRVALDGNSAGDTVADSYLPFHRGIYIVGSELVQYLEVSFKLQGTTYNASSSIITNTTEYLSLDNSNAPEAVNYYPVENDIEFLSVPAHEMELYNDEGKHHIAFYSKVENDTEGLDTAVDTFRMKILEDIEGSRALKTHYLDNNNNKVYYNLPSMPDSVTLAKKNADIYIGTGNKTTDKAKWFGKIKHSQFGKTLNSHRLLDAELNPIDDGQAIFNLSHVAYGSTSSSDIKDINFNQVWGIANGSSYLYAMDLADDSTTNNQKGIQQRSGALDFTPNSLSNAWMAHNALKALNNADWVIDNVTIKAGHTHNNTEPGSKTSYFWTNDALKNKLYILAADLNNDTDTVTVTVLATISPSFESGKSAPSSAVITDVREVMNDAGNLSRIYVLYGKPDKSGFSYGEEFVWSFAWNTINWSGGGQHTVTLYPKTPSAIKVHKTYGWDPSDDDWEYTGQGGYCYTNPDNFKNQMGSIKDSWIEGVVGSSLFLDELTNRIGIKRTDELGQTSDDWNYITGQAWDDANAGSLDLGDGGGWDGDEEYSNTPHPKGLVDIGDQRVGLISHIKGERVTDNGYLNGTHVTHWGKRKYAIYPGGGESVSVDGVYFTQITPNHKGVNHARRSDGSGDNNLINWIQTVDGKQYRFASYAQGDATDANNLRTGRLMSRTTATGHASYSDVQRNPDINDIVSISPIVRDFNDNYGRLFMSIKGSSTNATFLQAWKVYATTNSNQSSNGAFRNSMNSQGPVGNYWAPHPMEKLGSSAMAAMPQLSASPVSTIHFFLSPTLGEYIAANNSWSIPTGWATPLTNEDITGYPDPNYVNYLTHSKLDFGIAPSDGDLSGGSDGNFLTSSTYYYKISLLYDGYQESPLSSFSFNYSPSANANTISLRISLKEPNPRVTDINIYRKNNVEDYYRKVDQISLANGWSQDATGSMVLVTVDDGRLTATYEAFTGMPETLNKTSVSYKTSVAAGGYLLVGGCYHPEVTNGENFIFRSQPDNFSVFNWTQDFIILPNEPTTLAYWSGRLFAFDKTTMYRINLENMFIEDDHKGVGCFGEKSFVVTDFGLFFCDANNIYMHNGSNVVPIGDSILKSAAYDDKTTGSYTKSTIKSWHNINHASSPLVAYDAFNGNVMFMWSDADGSSGSWNYNIPRKRWDLTTTPNPVAYLQGPNSERFLSDGTHFYELNDMLYRDNFEYHSPSLDFGQATVDKKIKKVKLVFSEPIPASGSSTEYSYTIEMYSDGALLKTFTHPANDNASGVKNEEHVREYILPTNKTKKFKIIVKDCNTEIDSIGITYLYSSYK